MAAQQGPCSAWQTNMTGPGTVATRSRFKGDPDKGQTTAMPLKTKRTPRAGATNFQNPGSAP